MMIRPFASPRDFISPGRSATWAAGAMVATSHPLAAQVAVQILAQGGNAVDAGIAASIILGLAEPMMTGLGGDLFALYWPPGANAPVGLNASGRAPAALDVESLRQQGLTAIPPDSVKAVTVPGAVAGLARLHADFARLDWAALLAPGIAHAEAGVPVAPRVARDWADNAHRLKGRAQLYYHATPPQIGDRFRAPAQAELLRILAREGAKGFYEGVVAADMVRSLRALGGDHTEADFAATRADYVTPIMTRYRGHDIWELPPNGQGATALLMLNMLAAHDLAALAPFGADRLHLEAEVAALAYDARNRHLADGATAARLLDPQLAVRLNALYQPARSLGVVPTLTEAAHRDTVLFVAVDADGGALSLIYSIFWPFGSGIASDRFGVLFQNRGSGFTLLRGHPNEAMGGKRPLHTIIPGIMADGTRPLMPFGVMGGQYQAAGHARLISNLVDYDMEIQAAIDAPRSFPEDGVLWLEPGHDPAVVAALAARGHKISLRSVGLGGAQAIFIDHARGVLVGGSDARKDGMALGF